MLMKDWHTIKLSNTMLDDNSVAGIMESISIEHDRISYSVIVQVLRRTNSLAKSTRAESQYYFTGPSY